MCAFQMKKRPRDPNQLAKFIVDMATAGTKESRGTTADGKKIPEAVALGTKGGRKGGRARAEALSPERRKEIARLAASKRWGKPK